MPDLLEAYAAGGGAGRFQPTYAGSGTLRQQVEAGAPVGGVVFAGAEPVDRLVEKGLVEASSRVVLARNVLVLVGRSGSPALTFRTLQTLPGGERISIGDARSVPAGRYAREALERLGVWEAIRDRVVPARDVAAVAAYVKRGEVALGVVYATEARGVPGLEVLDRAEGDWAPRPVIVAGACARSEHAALVRNLLAFLTREGAVSIWERHGFLRP